MSRRRRHTFAASAAGLLLAPLVVLHAAGEEVPAAGETILDIRSFGASGDGKTLNTAAIQQAIDACHAAGGGRVVVPAGVFLTGPVPGLAKLADVRRVTTRNCRIEAGQPAPVLVEPSAEEQRRLANLRQRAAALDQALQQTADAVDAAQRASQLLVLPAVWDFRSDPCSQGEQERWFAAEPDANWTKLRVDQPWTRQGHANLRGAGWYAVTFAVPPQAEGQRVFLRFGAVSGTCRVWLDGKPVGERTIDPAYVKNFPWALDLSGVLQPSASHRLAVRVVGDSAHAGLTQPVELRLAK